MPTIYDNITQHLLPGLKESLVKSDHADFCVGYFNMRGWVGLAEEVDVFEGGEGKQCRLLIGMQRNVDEELMALYGATELNEDDQKRLVAKKKKLAMGLREQLIIGLPSNRDEKTLRRLAQQIREKKVVVKLFLRHALHAKLYLSFLKEQIIDIKGFVGSSNLTFSGLQGNGELNVDVVDADATKKLAAWFEDRWTDDRCVDISEELLEIIENSWAGVREIPPYHVFMKMVYHLSNEARLGLKTYELPPRFKNELLTFQADAVLMAARVLDKRGGVLIGDVVGLGKTFTAAALIKLMGEREYIKTLVICPPNLMRMWEHFKQEYQLFVDICSIGDLKEGMRDKHKHCRMVVIDESHNLRNHKTKRYAALKDYIAFHDSKVVLLTATPYNKTYLDLSSQIALFLDPEEDIGIRPEERIKEMGGVQEFNARYNVLPSSLRAFEHSEHVDDWRDLMKLFMVRRTRSFIKAHSPVDEETGKPYLQFHNGDRFYFPTRISKPFLYGFDPNDKQDPYAQLYNREVVDTIAGLHLARYGLGLYIDDASKERASAAQLAIINDLGRAGQRMIGYARTSLFKRLESSGPAFLLSIQRHVLRNHLFIHALEHGLDVPVGLQDAEILDSVLDDDDPDLMQDFDATMHEAHYAEQAERIYAILLTPKYKKRFRWLAATLFMPSLHQELLDDARALHSVWQRGKQWDPALDKQLNALYQFCAKDHKNEKVLIFTQFADTALYLHEQMKARGLDGLEVVTGQLGDPTLAAYRFSPRSNAQPKIVDSDKETRVLISTDVLSEGQNLQDSHIIINYDLPWALIRLIQRAGRVDRIGQKSPQVYCFSLLPEQGLDNILFLRGRLADRMKQNAEVVGTDESFFEGDRVGLHDLYAERSDILDQGEGDDVDLGSWAYQLWAEAIERDPTLEKTVKEMADVVLSTKTLPDTEDKKDVGVAVFVRTAQENDLLVWMNSKGELVSQSQWRIIKALECGPHDKAAERLTEHHEIVGSGVRYIQQNENAIGGGALGRRTGARYQVWGRLNMYFENQKNTLFEQQELKQALDSIYHHPLRESAKDLLNMRLREGVSDDTLADVVLALHQDGKLVNKPAESEDKPHGQPRIICSMGLRPTN